MNKVMECAKSVTIITTGGTIEKSYSEFDGSLSNRESRVKERILSKLRLPYTHIHVISVLSKDSLHLTEYDRSVLIKTIKGQQDAGKPIVILHGTDTMAKSAKRCFEEIKFPIVPIIFTGAMKPFGFEDSDATQNVTEALLAAKFLVPGVYISFHNEIFKLPNVRKNIELGTFERVDG